MYQRHGTETATLGAALKVSGGRIYCSATT